MTDEGRQFGHLYGRRSVNHVRLGQLVEDPPLVWPTGNRLTNLWSFRDYTPPGFPWYL